MSTQLPQLNQIFNNKKYIYFITSLETPSARQLALQFITIFAHNYKHYVTVNNFSILLDTYKKMLYCVFC